MLPVSAPDAAYRQLMPRTESRCVVSGDSLNGRAIPSTWRTGAWMLAVALVLSSCSGGDSPAKGDAPPKDLTALNQRLDALLTSPEAERRAELARMGVELQNDLAEVSGLADALGGGDAAAATLARAWAPTVAGTLALEKSPIDLGFHAGSARATGSATGTNEGMFAGLLSIGLMAGGISDSNGSTDAQMAGQATASQGNPRTQTKVARDKVSGTVTGELTTDGVTTRLSTTLDVATCPDPKGDFEAKAKVDVSVSKGGAGQRTTIEVTVQGTVGENAELSALDISFRAQAGRSSGARGEFIDLSGTAGLGPAGDVRVNRSGGKVSDALRQETQDLGSVLAMVIGLQLYAAADEAWKSGRCVRLAFTASPGPTGLEPGSTSSIKATPRSKIDGTPTRGEVTATLSTGGADVAPGSAPADATFTYTAPDKSGDGGTVALEARSRRGIGKAEVVLSTGGAYVASGSSDGVTFSGKVAGLSAPFTIEIAFPGADAGTFSFEPTAEAAGAVTVKARGSGAVVTGGGTYTVTDNPDGTKTLTAKVRSCVDVSGQCRSGVHPILLTPTS